MARARFPQRRPLRPDEAALSNVLGAIMIFGLLVITLVTIQVRFVPVWTEDRESKHVDTVIDQLSLFKADVERLSTNTTGGTLTDPLTINPESGFKFFQAASAGGSAEFVPSDAGEGFTLESPQLRITRRDGQGLFALGEVWDSIPTSDPPTDVVAIDHLRVRVDDPAGQDGATTLEITDADGDYAGKVVITATADPPDAIIRIEVFNSTSDDEPFTSQEEFWHQSGGPEFVYFNLLDDELLFNQVLAAAEAPFDLVLTNPDAIGAEFTSAYTTATGGSSGTDGGFVVPSYSTALSSGSLVFQTNNQRLPQQTFVVEHGAILVVQPDGAAMLVPPTVSVVATEDEVVVDWVVPGLTGSATGISGVRAASLLAGAAGFRTGIEANAWQVNFTVPTAYPVVWEAFLQDLMELAGLTDDPLDPQFEVDSTANNVTLTIHGPVSDPSDHDEDVFLRYQQASIALELRPTG